MRAAQWIWARLVRPTLAVVLMCIGVYTITRCNKDEGVGARDAEPFLLNNSLSKSGADFAEVKRLATLQAVLALKGFELHPTTTGIYIVMRWNWACRLATLDDVQDFAQQVGVQL